MPEITNQKPPNKMIIFFYRLGLGRAMGRFLLLLTTTGRKSGKKYTTPVQYEEMNGNYVVAAADGLKANWVKNLLANPLVDVQVKMKRFKARAEVETDPGKIADFLEYRLQKNPEMLGRILQADGLSATPGRADLEQYSRKLAMVTLKPE